MGVLLVCVSVMECKFMGAVWELLLIYIMSAELDEGKRKQS